MKQSCVWALAACLTCALGLRAETPAADEEAPCAAGNRLWFTAEHLTWWIKDSPLPVALVTRGPAADSDPGAIGQPGTQIVLGAEDLDNKLRQGGRFAAGLWIDADSIWGLEGGYFFLAQRTVRQEVGSPGGPTGQFLAAPFYNVTTAMEDTADLPGPLAGSDALALSSRLQGAEANIIYNLCCGACWRLDGLIGFRFLNLAENLAFATHSRTSAGAFIDTLDRFDANNHYYGGQIGARLEYDVGDFFFRAIGKAALGGMNQHLQIAGAATASVLSGATAQSFPGGVFAQPSINGTYDRVRRAIIAEADFQVGYRLADWASLFVGWTYLTADKVVRPGNQIDRSLNLTRTPMAAAAGIEPQGPKRPEFDFKESSFWAQGISGGVEFRY